ncbi:MAG: hemolysin family protein [Oscillospiraceae bacterium]|jgi:putative hemolysin|nr:hemolysin family protein [Oscillospiraceae bacterium]
MPEIFILIVLISLNAFFALSEIAIVTLNDKKIKKMDSQGHKGASKVLELLSDSSDFLATIQVGITLSGFLTSASASKSFAEPLANALSFLKLPRNILEGISMFVITAILSYFSLVFGELVPKKIAMQNAEEVSFKVVGILLFFSKIFKPFIWLLSNSSNFVMRCFGLNPKLGERTVTEEEILMMVDAGKEKGLIESRAKNMIENVFDFDNITIEEIMTHRIDIVGANSEITLEKAVEMSIECGYSRIPIFKENIDEIIGILYMKDLLKFINKVITKDLTISKIMRPAMFVPSTKRCNKLFSEFTSSKTQIAIVVDEYGGTEGLVTMEDLVESILGNIQDEYDNEEEDIRKTGENTFTVDGSTLIGELEEIAKIKIPSGNYDTVGGFLSEKLGRIPKEKENPVIKLGNISFTVLEVTNRRIAKVRIENEIAES